MLSPLTWLIIVAVIVAVVVVAVVVVAVVVVAVVVVAVVVMAINQQTAVNHSKNGPMSQVINEPN